MLDMRKTGAWAVAPLIAAGLLLGAGGAPAQSAPTEVKPISWDVAGIGASGRTLRLQYSPGWSCGTFIGARTRVNESPSAVRIELFDLIDFPPPSIEPMPCPAVLLSPRQAYVTLAAPLAGRAIKGRISFPGTTVAIGPPNYPPQQPDALIRVPRVVGFSVREARRMIWRSGLNVRIRRSRRPVARPRVIGQAPSGALKPQRVVRLHVAIPRY